MEQAPSNVAATASITIRLNMGTLPRASFALTTQRSEAWQVPRRSAVDLPEHGIGRLDQALEVAAIARWNGELAPHHGGHQLIGDCLDIRGDLLALLGRGRARECLQQVGHAVVTRPTGEVVAS